MYYTYYTFMMTEEAQEQQKKNNLKARPNTNGVIITVYVESPIISSRQKCDPLKSIKPKPFAKRPETARTRGYDRRAQLLAYAGELRDANSQQLQWPKNNSRPKPKIWKWETLPTRFLTSLKRMFHRRWRYERIISEETRGVDQLCRPKCIKWRKTKATKRCKSQFCRGLRCMLIGLSCACKGRARDECDDNIASTIWTVDSEEKYLVGLV